MLKRLLWGFTAAVVVFCVLMQDTITAKGFCKTVVKILTENKIYEIQNSDLRYLYYEPQFDGVSHTVEKIYSETYLPAKNSVYVFQNGTIKVTKSLSGKKIDKEKLLEDLKICLAAGGGAVSVNYIDIEPDYSEKDFPGNICLRGRFSTEFSGSSQGRIHNINLATQSLKGVTVYSGEVFSFNELVGARNEKTGYESAKVIVGGEYVDGVGGGVCQVSTTLYNAALLSGLDVIEHHRHTLAVNYVEKSFDAMVSYGYADLKILNSTAAPIFICGKVDDYVIYFDIYGEYNNKSIGRESVVTKIIEPTVTMVENASLRKGESRTAIFAKRGYESEGYLVIRENGRVLKKLLRKDQYKKVDGVVEIGK